MKEYIEKAAARDLMEQALADEWEIQYADDRMDEIPAADVVEVRYARWDRVDYGNGLYNYHCSLCRHIPRENIRSNYCPNCGAKMEV